MSRESALGASAGGWYPLGMIVKFSARNGQLAMFGDAALSMLRMLGHSGSIPGAILAADLPQALQRLQAGIVRDGDTPSPEPGADAPHRAGEDEEQRRPPVTLRMRSVPLVELIEGAIARGSDLMWERG
jgi:uncharacterized protein DUF1840